MLDRHRVDIFEWGVLPQISRQFCHIGQIWHFFLSYAYKHREKRRKTMVKPLRLLIRFIWGILRAVQRITRYIGDITLYTQILQGFGHGR